MIRKSNAICNRFCLFVLNKIEKNFIKFKNFTGFISLSYLFTTGSGLGGKSLYYFDFLFKNLMNFKALLGVSFLIISSTLEGISKSYIEIPYSFFIFNFLISSLVMIFIL